MYFQNIIHIDYYWWLTVIDLFVYPILVETLIDEIVKDVLKIIFLFCKSKSKIYIYLSTVLLRVFGVEWFLVVIIRAKDYLFYLSLQSSGFYLLPFT